MISHKLTLICIFSMLLVLSSSMTFQPALAADPFARITGGLFPTEQFANGASFPIRTGQSTVEITMSYIGADDDNHINYFECKWDTDASYSRANCSTMTAERLGPLPMSVSGPSVNHYIKEGTASRPLGVGTHTFSVRVVNCPDGTTLANCTPTRSTTGTTRTATPNPFTFTITPAVIPSVPQPPLQPSGPSVSITRLTSTIGFIVSEAFPDDNGDVIVWTEARGDGLSRRCFTLGSGPIPANPSIPTTPFSPITQNGCVSDIFGPLSMSTSTGNRIEYGLKYVCVAVWDQNNIRSPPSCYPFNVVGSTIPSPITRIEFHRPNTGTAYQNLQDGQTTQYRNIHFTFSANPSTNLGQRLDPTRAAIFSCLWDNQGTWHPCGQMPIFSATLCMPPEGGISNCPQNIRVLVVPYLGKHIVQDVSNGRHSVQVLSKYASSHHSCAPNPTFTWCFVSCTVSASDYRPITEQNRFAGSPSMVTDVNQSSAVTLMSDAGMDKAVNKNTDVILNGNLYIIPALSFPINGTISDLKEILPTNFGIKSIYWKQISGPEVKLNSTDTLAVKFKAPDIKNNKLLKFNLTITDDKDLEQSDIVNVWVNTNNATTNQTDSKPKDKQASALEGE